ncbi:MAG: hypothetical protein LBS80_02250 [Tannerella sp.]|jgi:hypothetical protein|nr:hypothetical protein [Tannerella sp.]
MYKNIFGRERRMKGRVCISGLALTCLLVMLPAASQGQENRRWALRYGADFFDKPILTHNPTKVSTGDGSSAFAVMGEYFLPNKWSLQAGYFSTKVSYGDATRHIEGARMGARRYLLHPDFFVQPYLSAAGEFNWGQGAVRHTSGATWESRQANSYTVKQNTVNPRLSVVSGVGVEMYLFSSVAIFAEYNISMGIASRTTVERSWENGTSCLIRDKGMFHSLSMGAKLTFPFTFTSDDGKNLLSFVSELIDSLLYN